MCGADTFIFYINMCWTTRMNISNVITVFQLFFWSVLFLLGQSNWKNRKFNYMPCNGKTNTFITCCKGFSSFNFHLKIDFLVEIFFFFRSCSKIFSRRLKWIKIETNVSANIYLSLLFVSMKSWFERLWRKIDWERKRDRDREILFCIFFASFVFQTIFLECFFPQVHQISMYPTSGRVQQQCNKQKEHM